MKKLKLIVTADDGFYAERRDQGIVECLEAGKTKQLGATDVSVMMNGSVARSLLRQHPAQRSSALLNFCKINFFTPGLHLNLTEGIPTSSPCSVRTLLNKTDHFLGKFGIREKLSTLSLFEVEKECNNQLELFKELFGTYPIHIDGHQHVHILPGIREVLGRILPRHGINWVRIPEELCLEKNDPPNWPLDNYSLETFEFYKNISHLAAESRHLWCCAGLNSTDFIGMLLMGQTLRVANIEAALSPLLNSECTVELMTHPGYPLTRASLDCQGCSELTGADEFSCSPDRIQEMDVLLSESFREMIQKLSITLCSFDELSKNQ